MQKRVAANLWPIAGHRSNEHGVSGSNMFCVPGSLCRPVLLVHQSWPKCGGCRAQFRQYSTDFPAISCSQWYARSRLFSRATEHISVVDKRNAIASLQLSHHTVFVEQTPSTMGFKSQHRCQNIPRLLAANYMRTAMCHFHRAQHWEGIMVNRKPSQCLYTVQAQKAYDSRVCPARFGGLDKGRERRLTMGIRRSVGDFQGARIEQRAIIRAH